MSNSFKTLGFAPQLEKLIEANGFTSPTPIQMKAIPLVRQGYDLLAAAQTGTGKTAAFVLPMLQKMIEEPTLYQKRVPRVLVLTPTRELAAQVGETILSLGKDLGVRSAVVFGGVGINGHVAFNEAQDELTPDQFRALPTRVLEISRETRTANAIGDLNGAVDDMPRWCVTIGMREICSARKIRLGCFRDWHRAVVRHAAYGDVSAHFPVTLLQEHPDTLLRMTEFVANLPE